MGLRSRVERGRLLGFEITHDGPHEAGELAGYGDDSDLGRFPVRDAVVELVEPVLRLPGMGDDGGRLPVLSLLELLAHGGSHPVVPGGLDEHVATSTVAGLGDGAPALAVAGGVLAGDEAEVGHELSGSLEASPVADLGD